MGDHRAEDLASIPSPQAGSRFPAFFHVQRRGFHPRQSGTPAHPPHLREYAHLEKDIVLVGMLRNVEIWDKESFEVEMKRMGEQNADSQGFLDYMADLGI